MPTGVQRLPTNYAALLGSSGNFTVSIGSTTGGDLYTFAHRTLTNQTDALLNDSDKTFTVPAGRLWWVHSIFVLLTTTATVGNRRMLITVQPDASNDSYHLAAFATQAENLTNRYNLMPGPFREASFTNNQIVMPIPTHLLIPAAGTVRVRDSAAIAATADDMTVTLVYDEITV